jgi:hypothetical protein
MVECGILAEWFGAVRAAVVPLLKDFVPKADLRFLSGDQFGLINLMIHTVER